MRMADRKEISTPLGDYTRVSNNYYTSGGQPWSMNWAGISNGEAGYQAGAYGDPSAPTFFQSAYLPGEERFGQYVPDFNKSFSTPLGNVNFESNYEIPNSIDANFTPNSKTYYYIQALANLLNSQR